MTEQEWEDCENPKPMMDLLMRSSVVTAPDLPDYIASDRKLHLLEDATWERFGLNLDDFVCQEKPPEGSGNLVREIFGNPFKPLSKFWKECEECNGSGKIHEGFQAVPVDCGNCEGKGKLPDSPLLTWRDGLILATAEQIHTEGKWEDTSILADMLEDAGMQSEEKCQRCEGNGMLFDPSMWHRGYGLEGMKQICTNCKGKGKLPNPILLHLRNDAPIRIKTVTTILDCPVCGKRGFRRHGMHFDHEFRCGECSISWEPGKKYAWNDIREVRHCRGCHVIDALRGVE